MKLNKYEIEQIKNALMLNRAGNTLLNNAYWLIVQLEEENKMLKEQINTAGLPGKCCTCSQFRPRIGKTGTCKILGNKVVQADQDCVCPKLRGRL